MNLYRIAYNPPKSSDRKRVTLAAEDWDILRRASLFVGKGYLLSIVEIRPLMVQEELVLT